MTGPMPERLVDENVREAALGILEAVGELDQWDIEPTLVLVAEGPDKPINIPVPVPTLMWLAKHPADVLRGIAYGVSNGLMRLELSEPVTTGDIRGVILFTEGHDVRFEELTEAEKVTFDDFKARHRLEEHPKSRELRMATMIDRSLTVAMAQHVRGEDVSERIVYGLQGLIPEALSRLATAMLAAWTVEADKRN